jgi:hypothetical protein
MFEEKREAVPAIEMPVSALVLKHRKWAAGRVEISSGGPDGQFQCAVMLLSG